MRGEASSRGALRHSAVDVYDVAATCDDEPAAGASRGILLTVPDWRAARVPARLRRALERSCARPGRTTSCRRAASKWWRPLDGARRRACASATETAASRRSRRRTAVVDAPAPPNAARRRTASAGLDARDERRAAGEHERVEQRFVLDERERAVRPVEHDLSARVGEAAGARALRGAGRPECFGRGEPARGHEGRAPLRAQPLVRLEGAEVVEGVGDHVAVDARDQPRAVRAERTEVG